MRAANIANSPRLQRVLGVLFDGEWHSTRTIIRRADVCAVNSCVAELKAPINGYAIISRCVKPHFDTPAVWEYKLLN